MGIVYTIFFIIIVLLILGVFRSNFFGDDQKLNPLNIFLAIIFIIAFWYFLRWVYRKYKSLHTLTTLADAKISKPVRSSELPNGSTNDFTISVWFIVNDWNYRYGDKKILLTRSLNGHGPEISFDANSNDINIKIDTYKKSSDDTAINESPSLFNELNSQSQPEPTLTPQPTPEPEPTPEPTPEPSIPNSDLTLKEAVVKFYNDKTICFRPYLLDILGSALAKIEPGRNYDKLNKTEFENEINKTKKILNNIKINKSGNKLFSNSTSNEKTNFIDNIFKDEIIQKEINNYGITKFSDIDNNFSINMLPQSKIKLKTLKIAEWWAQDNDETIDNYPNYAIDQLKCDKVENFAGRNIGTNQHTCTVKNFPLQKWVNLIISVNGHSLDVYIDGKLTKTCILPGIAKIDKNQDIILTPDGGFNGFTSHMIYIPTSSNTQEAYNIFMKGHGSAWYNTLFDKYKLKVSLMKDNVESSSIHI